MKPPTETKVVSAGAGAGGFALVSQAVIWLLGCWLWGASWDADKATDALAAVPFPLAALITAGAAWLGARVAGYLAPHTHRPDLDPPVDDYLPEHEQHPKVDAVGLDILHDTAPIERV